MVGVRCVQLLAQAAAIQQEAARHVDRELALKLHRWPADKCSCVTIETLAASCWASCT